jgi:hypothetical protein
MIRPLPTLTRWGRRSTLLAGTSQRFECAPPSLRQSPQGSLWQRLMFWLLAPAALDAAPPVNRLPLVRQEFMATMADISGVEADRLRWRVQEARSLRELWHVRADLYRVVAVEHSQTEAEERLLMLSHHFPTRAPRSQFGNF